MTGPDQEAADREARRRAQERALHGDPVAWFEDLYAAAGRGEATVPWDHGHPHARLQEWIGGHSGPGRAVVVGCGPGDDAELVAAHGWDVTAFDVAPSAVRAARARHPGSPVDHRVGDLLAPRPEWVGAFDLVVEVRNVQSLPLDLREQATAGVTSLVAPGGRLLVLAAARDTDQPPDGPPWPLSRSEVEAFARDGLVLDALGRHDPIDPGAYWTWQAELSR